MNDDKPIPASAWRAVASRAWGEESWQTIGAPLKDAWSIVARNAAREAEKAEAREKAEPSDRERLREDVRGEIAHHEATARADLGAFDKRYHIVRAAELRDFYKRTFGEDA